MDIILLQASPGGGSGSSMVFIMIIFLVFMIFFTYLPNRKMKKEQAKFLEEMKKGGTHKIKILPSEVAVDDKASIIKRADKAARAYSEEISQVACRYQDYVQNVWIANTEGTYVNDTRVRTRLAVNSVASNETDKQSGHNGPGGHWGFEFYDMINVEEEIQKIGPPLSSI